MKWQTVGSDLVRSQSQRFVTDAMVETAEPRHIQRLVVVLMVRFAGHVAAFLTRLFGQFSTPHCALHSFSDPIARSVLRALHFSNVCLGIGVLVSSCSVRAAYATEPALTKVHLSKNSVERSAAAFTTTIYKCLTHKRKVADGRDSYPTPHSLAFGLAYSLSNAAELLRRGLHRGASTSRAASAVQEYTP